MQRLGQPFQLLQRVGQALLNAAVGPLGKLAGRGRQAAQPEGLRPEQAPLAGAR
jgi:hypothetical protein